MVPMFLRFSDLKARQIVDSWAQLKKLQDNYGFPSGRTLGPCTRVWTESEVMQWLDSRPTVKREPRGRAKRTEAA